MRILIISHGHPAFSIGGAEVASHNLFKALGETDGIEAFYLSRAPTSLSRHADTPLMSLRQGERETFLHTDAWDPFWLSNGGIPDLEGAFTDYLRHVRPDVVHLHHVIGVGVEMIVQIRRVLPDAAIVITFHEYLAICLNHGQMVKTSRNTLCRSASPAECAGCFPEHGPGQIFQREMFLKNHLLLADAFISPSEFLIGRYAVWGLPRDRFSMIENGLARQRVASPRSVASDGRRARFGFFGQLSEYKGLHILLQAVASIGDTVWGNDASLSIFGGNLENQPTVFRERFEGTHRTRGASCPVLWKLPVGRVAETYGASGLARHAINLVGEQSGGDTGSLPAWPSAHRWRHRRNGRKSQTWIEWIAFSSG